ncbi:MAG: hypothetical protein AAF735_07860 [Myxococcota bacterium]
MLAAEARPGATSELPIESVIEQTLEIIDDGPGRGLDKKMRALSELYPCRATRLLPLISSRCCIHGR